MSTQLKILIGILFTLGTLIAVVILGVNEDARMTRQQQTFEGRNIERGAEYFATYCYTCHGNRGEGVAGLGPPLNRTDLLDTKNAPYLRYIKWGGTLSDFLHDTIAAGRPQPSAYYASQNFANRMPTWSQDYGGPLRPDQVDSLVAFIENWAPGTNPPLVAIPTGTATPAVATGATPTPAPVAQVTPPFPLPPSQDIINAGKEVFTGKCVPCHGVNADGKGPAASALPKPPRNFTDCAAMQQFSMSMHYDAVENGRTANGMPAWKGNLTEDEIWRVIMYERSFCQVFTP
jgi:mono/diheme cytochrome c family protein